MTNRKGTEKPIEIFVALFIILAVALVMLQIFKNQISQSTTDLANQKQEAANQQLRQKLDNSCGDKCQAASNQGCDEASLASLCTYNSQIALGSANFIDLNNDQKEDYDTTLLAGVGVCENRIYCFNIMTGGCCQRSITPGTCKGILRDYWTQKGFSPAQITSMLDTTNPASPVYAGGSTCLVNGKIDANRWDQLSDWTNG